jgi:plastocyanin
MFIMVSALLVVPAVAQAQWHATLGAQSHDKGRQILAFLPNEIWIHAGDDITWTSQSDDIHTATFLIAPQLRPPFPVGCAPFPPGTASLFSPSGVSFDGSTCISSPPLVSGQAFKVVFPKKGNYKIVCLVHENMTGTIHVLDKSVDLPHNQRFYDQQSADELVELLAEGNGHGDHDIDHSSGAHSPGHNSVTVGTGEIVATGGGHETVSVVRFLSEQTVIHAGETVEWTNQDPVTPHTITFGTEPDNPLLPSGNNPILTDPDGALHATIKSTSDSVNSGLILAAQHERIGAPTSPLGPTQFRITFTKAGTYPYICALHDGLGMKGTIIVLP